MKRAIIVLGVALAVAITLSPFAESELEESAPTACETDSDCQELCPPGTRDLPADNDEYCDGGPQSDDGSPAWLALEQARLCRIDADHCEGGSK